MRAVLLTIGDELLIGQVVNTNAAWLGEQLSLLGIDVCRTVVVGDQETAIREALEHAAQDASLLVLTGGLGPTHDDVTKKAVAAFAGVELVLDPSILDRLEAYFMKKYGRMPVGNREIALVPAGFDVLDNPVGTAPGLWGTLAVGGRAVHVVILPGVPYEMTALMEQAVLPRLAGDRERRVIRHRTLLTAGIGESNLAQLIGDLTDVLDETLQLAYLPNPRTGVRLRLTARAEDEGTAADKLWAFETRLRGRVEPYVYGTGSDSLEAAVGRMLKARGLTVGFAESCTGGLVCSRMTDVAGASAYVLGGVVAYCNSAKVNILGVDEHTLEEHGAVSEPVALQMADGIRERLGASIGVSVTGVAGPSGGSPEKPVGTVWIGYADEGQTRAFGLQLGRERLLNKELAATAALNLIRRRLLKDAEVTA